MSPQEVQLTDRQVEALNAAAWSRRGTARQWPAFVAALAGELTAGARTEAARAFLRHVGRRLAAMAPLPAVETLDELETAINATWAAMDWGWVRLVASETHIRVIHGAWPELPGAVEGEAWAGVAPAFLEGVYAAWFQAQGSPLARTEHAPGRDGALEFRHAP